MEFRTGELGLQHPMKVRGGRLKGISRRQKTCLNICIDKTERKESGVSGGSCCFCGHAAASGLMGL